MLIGISRGERVIHVSPLLLVVVLCGYQIYQFLKPVYNLFKPEFLTRYKIVCTQGTRYRCCLLLNFHRYFEIKTKLKTTIFNDNKIPELGEIIAGQQVRHG